MTTEEKIKVINSWCISFYRGETYVGFLYSMVARTGFRGFYVFQNNDEPNTERVDEAYLVVEDAVWRTIGNMK